MIECLQVPSQGPVVVIDILVAFVIIAGEITCFFAEQLGKEFLVQLREQEVAPGSLPIEDSLVHVAGILFERLAAKAAMDDPGQVDTNMCSAVFGGQTGRVIASLMPIGPVDAGHATDLRQW